MPVAFYQQLTTQIMAARTEGVFKAARIITCVAG